MSNTFDLPFGVSDGKIVAYRAVDDRLEVTFGFWDGIERVLLFNGFIGLQDHAAIGVIASTLTIQSDTELIRLLFGRQFEGSHPLDSWRQFTLIDLDDQPMFTVIAESCELEAKVSDASVPPEKSVDGS